MRLFFGHVTRLSAGATQLRGFLLRSNQNGRSTAEAVFFGRPFRWPRGGEKRRLLREKILYGGNQKARRRAPAAGGRFFMEKWSVPRPRRDGSKHLGEDRILHQHPAGGEGEPVIGETA